eukprot:1156381-Pelagomonas_calceolata.AAC.5
MSQDDVHYIFTKGPAKFNLWRMAGYKTNPLPGIPGLPGYSVWQWMNHLCRYGNAGAVWDIWSVPDASLLRGYLQEHAHEFLHRGQPVSREEACA